MVLLLCFAAVIVQLVNIQFRQASALSNSPNNPRIAAQHFDNRRGDIYAADGTVLAKSVRTTDKTDQFHWTRVYPQGPLYAGITGYDSLFYGTAGIEYEYNQYLQTHAQPPRSFSQLLFDKPPSEPDSVTLTVDPVLQQAATQALDSTPGANKDGAVVVLDPTTGAVLAMVSNPTYDPNQVSSPDVSTEEGYHTATAANDKEGFNGLQPIATEQRFPPGSTFKVVTSMAAYNLAPNLISYNFPSAVSIKFTDSNKVLANDGGSACGGTMTLMLPQSCDPGYGQLGIQLGVPTLTKQAQDFGYSLFGQSNPYIPKIDLPNVIPSTFSDLPTNAQADLAYSAIGQFNDATTALQNALVAAGVADGGVIMTPHLMSQITDSQGNVVAKYKPSPMLTAGTAAAATSVNRLMQTVANDTVPGATANGIFPVSWHVAVKTGTAQVQKPGVAEETDDWMIGFMPAVGTPKVAIAVVVPQQTFSVTGAIVAGPIVKQVLQAYLTETGGQ
jgi:peptidoglycan glycosyltransferase